MRLILLRHGETLWNMDSRLQGHANSCLSTNGVKQTESIKEFVRLLAPGVSSHLTWEERCKLQKSWVIQMLFPTVN